MRTNLANIWKWRNEIFYILKETYKMEGEKYISEFLPALKKLGYDFTDPSRETSKKEK